jgi:hypothetical protein
MDGRIYEVLHGLGKVEAHLTEELDEVRHILRDLPSLGRPRSSTQNYETQQPMPSSPRISVDSLAEALAEDSLCFWKQSRITISKRVLRLQKKTTRISSPRPLLTKKLLVL